MISPGTAFLLAYSPSRRVAHIARRALVDRNANTVDQELRHAIEFSRAALNTEESLVSETEAKLRSAAEQAGVTLPAIPPPSGFAAWLRGLTDVVRPHLTTPQAQAAWKAGDTARLVAVSVELAAHIAYLRCAAPQNPDLRQQARDHARALRDSASRLTKDLEATGLPLVIKHAASIEKYVALTPDLEPTTTGGYRQLNELTTEIRNFLDGKVRQLDTAAPTEASAPPTAEEETLLQRILASPSEYSLRTQYAKLAQQRNDPRAELIRLQLTGSDAEANTMIQSHPEWTAPLAQLGARDIKFAGGFPNEVKIDADVLLTRGKELLAAAPLTRLHVRNAKGRVREVVSSPLLATIEALDLDDQGVTDDDLNALASSPHAKRLTQLDLRYNPITARGIEAIAASPHLKKLEIVSLDGNSADPVDRQEYVDETNYRYVPTDAGKVLEAKYGRLRWLHRS